MTQTELILNPDGSVYHVNVLPGDVANTILLVGDPGRVAMVSRYFDEIRVQKSKREFITHTGRIGDTWLTVISTGIGTDNVDIVMSEVDALFNVDFNTRLPKEEITPLTFVRVGTSGTIQKDIPVDSLVVSRYALGLDAFARLDVSFTDQLSEAWYQALLNMAGERGVTVKPAYMSMPDEESLNKLRNVGDPWITVTCAGFYGLQGRSIRLQSSAGDLFNLLSEFEYHGLRVGNLEMETAGIYLLAQLLGHRAISVNAIIANRKLGKFSSDPHRTVDLLIRRTLDGLAGVSLS